MVDADVEIAGVVGKGKLLTLTASEALEHKVAELAAPTVEAALSAAGIAGAEIRQARQTWAETLVRFLTHPVLSSLLMTIGLLGLLVEIRTPGFAVPGTVGLISLGLFFWGHWIVQLAGWEELLLVAFSRWKVERCFEDHKGEVGLDHYEGRSWLGLRRHLILSSVSYLFLARVHQELRGEKPGADHLPGPAGCLRPDTILVA